MNVVMGIQLNEWLQNHYLYLHKLNWFHKKRIVSKYLPILHFWVILLRDQPMIIVSPTMLDNIRGSCWLRSNTPTYEFKINGLSNMYFLFLKWFFSILETIMLLIKCLLSNCFKCFYWYLVYYVSAFSFLKLFFSKQGEKKRSSSIYLPSFCF